MGTQLADEPNIYKQLADYCECVKDAETKDIDDLINIISFAAGWAVEPCGTFLMSERREVIDLPPCMDCAYEFEPYYRPFDVESFKFALAEITEDGEEVTEITDVAYISSKGVFKVKTGLPSCKCRRCVCGCEPEYKLLVEYTAGYEELPDCLLPVFCNLLEVIVAKNKCDCGCGCDNTKEEAENEVRYATGDVVSVQLETDIGKLLVEQYKSQMATIVLTKPVSPLWGYVV